MFWHSTRKTKRSRGPNRKLLRVESLESRQLLSGVVNVVIGPFVAAGDMALLGDGDNNAVQVKSGPNVGDYTITGASGTLLRLNGSSATFQQLSVNGVNDDIFVDLDGGYNVFDFEGPAADGVSTVLGDLSIINHSGGNTNIIHNTAINGNLYVTKAFGAPGYSELRLLNTTVIGDTVVNNNFGGGGGGSKTIISGSQLQGGGPALQALDLDNGSGADVLMVQGGTEFGAGAWPALIPQVDISNGAGGSMTSFTANSKIYGNLRIWNGNNPIGTSDTVTFNAVEVLGYTYLNDDGGSSSISVQNSTLGSWISDTAPMFVNGAWLANGCPVMINNAGGFDQLTVIGSTIPFGLWVNNNAGPTGVWGSVTNIQTSSIGMRPGGPGLFAGDGLHLQGDNGADKVTIASSLIGGVAHLPLGGGNNWVKLDGSMMASLNLVTGAGNDYVYIGGCSIPVAVAVALDAGVDTLELRQGLFGLRLPDPLLGFTAINGGLGCDVLKMDTGIFVPLASFEIVTG
jgi:hypothetical protein